MPQNATAFHLRPRPKEAAIQAGRSLARLLLPNRRLLPAGSQLRRWLPARRLHLRVLLPPLWLLLPDR